VHTLAHIHVDDLSDDTNPVFMKEFYKALTVLCSDLFLARYKRANTLNDALVALPEQTEKIEEVGKRMFENIFEDAHDEIDRNNVVDDLLNTKLIRNKNNESPDYDREFMFNRLKRYTDFIVGSKLKSFLGDVEDNLSGVKKQGTELEVEKRLRELQVPDTKQRPITSFTSTRVREMSRQNVRNNALARSPLPHSFAPSRHSRLRTSHAHRHHDKNTEEEEEDFYETFLNAQIDELQNKIDELDHEYITLTRHSMDRSEHVKTLETEVASLVESTRTANTDSLEYEKLADMVKSSIKKLNTARSQLTHTMVSKNERWRRLQAYKKELYDRQLLLTQHRSKPAEEKEQRGERKLKSSMGRSEK